jgi:hypothetical protein
MRRPWYGVPLLSLVAVLSLDPAAAQEAPPATAPAARPQPAPSPTPSPSPRPRARRRRAPLKLDVDRHVDQAIEQSAEPPRFQTSIEVEGETPTVIFERRYTRGLDMECAPAGGGPPTAAETREVRYSLSPSADLGGVAKFLAKRLKGKGPERYFLYRMTRENGAVSYGVRSERVPDAVIHTQPTTNFELLETFKDSGSAARALMRLEQGLKAESSSQAPPPQWATRNCTPK